MDCALKISSMAVPIFRSPNLSFHKHAKFGLRNYPPTFNMNALSENGACFQSVALSSLGDVRRKSSLESMFRYDKAIPEEIIDVPVGLSLDEKDIGDNPRCSDCQAKGAVLCTTCSGSGLYVDSILESQGIIVKVRCLGCGGTGNIMCSDCGGRGHV